MTQFYSDVLRETDEHALPDCETLHHDATEANDGEMETGWYYWFCFPGCLPDSDPIGPFDTEDDAINGAREIL